MWRKAEKGSIADYTRKLAGKNPEEAWKLFMCG